MTGKTNSQRDVRSKRRRMLLPLLKKVILDCLTNSLIEKDYVSRVESEFRYFEFVNTLRLLSRQLFTQINHEDANAAK